VLSLGFLLLISLLLTAALSAAGKYVALYLPEAALQIAGFLVSFAVISLMAQANVRVRSNEGLARQEDTDAVRDAAPRSRTTELQVEAHEGRRF
jgi:hypothetical protein